MSRPNDQWLSSYYKLRMYHKNALDERSKLLLCNAWNDLNQHEMKLVMRHEGVAKIFKEHMGSGLVLTPDSEKFHAYLADLEWVYIIERIGIPGICGFMAVTGDRQILSLFITDFYRKNGLGRYLIFNHIEIFGGSVSLQCFKFNQNALKFYSNLGFLSSYTAKEEDNSDLYHTLVLTV